MFGGLRVLTILVCSYGVSPIEGGNFGYQYPTPVAEAPVPPPSNYYGPVDYQPVLNPNPEPTYSYYPPGPPSWDNVQWQPVESLPWSYDDSSERVKPYYPSYQYVGSTTPCPKKKPPTTTTTTTKRTTVIPITTTTLPPHHHLAGLHSLMLTKGLTAVLPATPVPTTLAPTTLAPPTPAPVPPRPAGHGHLRYHDHHKHHHNPDHYHKHHHHHHQGSRGSATVVQNTEVETLAPRINAVIRDLEEKVRELKLSFFNYGRLEDVNGREDETVSPFADKKEDPQEKEGKPATDEGTKDSGRIGDLTTHAEQQPETEVAEELDPDNEESDMHPVDQNEGRFEANVHLQPEHRKVGAPQGVVPWFSGVDIDLPRDLPLEDDYGYGNGANYGSPL